MTNIYAFLALSVGFFVVLALCLIALARIGKFMTSVEDLDWEAVAALTGDIGALKKSVQRLNNRINGMESRDPSMLLDAIAQQNIQQSAVPEASNKLKGG
jgi:cell division protein FtsB